MERNSHRFVERLRREISDIVLTKLHDPRLKNMVTITDIGLSADNKHARMLVSVMGSISEKADTLNGLKSASGYMRRELGKRLRLKNIPALNFMLDPREVGIPASSVVGNH